VSAERVSAKMKKSEGKKKERDKSNSFQGVLNGLSSSQELSILVLKKPKQRSAESFSVFRWQFLVEISDKLHSIVVANALFRQKKWYCLPNTPACHASFLEASGTVDAHFKFGDKAL